MNQTIDYEKLKLFYIGKEILDDNTSIPLVYKNKHLRTHAAILGMTGSGKTGLGISLLEEASIDNIPSIIIDPKGDMGNLLLTFPDLKAEDFKPWIEKQDAINSNQSVEELAEKTALMWEDGIKKDFQSKQRIKKLKDSADFTIYTPGSSAGVQISILGAFKAPSKEVLEDDDMFISIVNSTVNSLLNLVDDKFDSSSKEAILLSSIFMHYYSKSEDLSLEKIISNIVNPPFEKIGVFELETFFSQESRLKFALKLNNIIANPSFKTWIEGESLDISKLLYDENGKAKVSIFTISHLDDKQRMFFVSLLLNQFLSWMRKQEGTSSLKALLYMDEIYGYFPPTKNPPSKQAMLTLLKQARSFGVGVVLSTQNPVDLDYKGLSNIGTWFIGRLQTKQDISKVIDGLNSASDDNFDKQELVKQISGLEKRTFLLKNINESKLKLFKTRWVLSYLKGPLSKNEIKRLMLFKKDTKKEFVEKQNIVKKKPILEKQSLKPILPNSITQRFLYSSQNSSYFLQGYLYITANIDFVNSTRGVDSSNELSYRLYLDENIKDIDFDDLEEFSIKAYESVERKNSSYYPIPTFLQNQSELKQIEKDFSNYLYRNKKLTIYKNSKLKIYSREDESLDDFKIRVQDRLNEKIDEQIEKIEEKYEKKQDSLENKLKKLYDKLEKEEEQASQTTTNTLISIGSSILGAFFGKSILSKTNIGKVSSGAKGARRVLKERKDVKIVEDNIEELQDEIEELKNNLIEEVENINKEFHISNYKTEEYYIKPRRKDIYNIDVSISWIET